MKTLDNGKIIVDNLSELIKIVKKKEIPLELIDIKESSLISLYGVFYNIEEINGSIKDWDVSGIKSFNCTFFNSSLNCDLSKWNVSSCKDMYSMFHYSKFNNDSLKNWDLSNVERIEYMFAFSNFNGDISNWDISNVLNMKELLSSCSFDRDISKWNFNKGVSCTNIFYHNKNFEKKYNSGKELPTYTGDFLIWFEENRDKIRDIHNPKEEILDFFSFDSNLDLNKDS